MKAINTRKNVATVDGLFLDHDVPVPKVGPNQALVKVYAFAVNRADILQRETHHKLPESVSPILGLEFSGVIIDVADNSTFSKKDQVCGLVYGGAYAEYVVCELDMMLQIPHGVSFNEAAAIPHNWFSALEAVSYLGEFKKRDKVVINAASTDSMAVLAQLVQVLGCRRVFVPASTERQVNFIRQDLTLLGALRDEVVAVVPSENYVDIVKKWDPKGVQLLVNERGLTNQDLHILSLDGRLIVGGYDLHDRPDLLQLVHKRLRIHGMNLRTRSPQYLYKPRDFISEHIMPKFSNGRLRIFLDSVYNWKDIASAHKRYESGEAIGKIVCTVVDEPFR